MGAQQGEPPANKDQLNGFEKALVAINEWNPVANAYDALLGYVTGKDRFGDRISNTQATIKLATVLPIFKVGKVVIKFGAYKGTTKWLNQMNNRGWNGKLVQEALETEGKVINSINNINPGNPLRMFVHPSTNRGVIVDDVTKEIIHLTDDLASWKL